MEIVAGRRRAAPHKSVTRAPMNSSFIESGVFLGARHCEIDWLQIAASQTACVCHWNLNSRIPDPPINLLSLRPWSFQSFNHPSIFHAKFPGFPDGFPAIRIILAGSFHPLGWIAHGTLGAVGRSQLFFQFPLFPGHRLAAKIRLAK